MSLKKAIGIIVLILLIDQISKIYIKTHFVLGEDVVVFNWFKILFVENEGMAWGTKIPGDYGKIILTGFRICILPLIGYWLYDSVRKHASRILIVAVALIFAGAFGNIIDSIFYGVIFNGSEGEVATFLPEAGGYGTWFHGKVVDMLYFPMWEGYLPEWLPIWGGKYFTFFNAVFNIADTAISVGVGLLLVFNKRAFAKDTPKQEIEEPKTEEL
ncbi:MAG: lipoprotein signal peptidase [Cytophagaceae bacterium]|nr:lipoprotein signal peptidase [Cytophagaceae bacterium]|tara:strand:+ start:17093 stop:17734 length:642 start_codon:yes stop_codon:yes gene_type:complete